MSPSENVEKLLEFVVKEDVSEFVEMHVLVPFWHELGTISIAFIQLKLVWSLWTDEQIVGFVVLHFHIKSIFIPVPPDVPLAEHDDG